jgi:hypothetical protein
MIMAALQKAEEVPGLRFRGRRVYLEQRSTSPQQAVAEHKEVKRDCLHFAIALHKLQDSYARGQGLIVIPKVLSMGNREN